ncbi:MAG: homoserine kinase [Campylobacteraceae bacterium]|nr:homoserine kinase [Campylobacteraceae bacterium]
MKIRVPATSANLGPGFDALGLALKLYNETVIEHSNYFCISVKGEGSDNPRIKTNNTFVNIFYDIYKELTGKRDDFKFSFFNSIPFSRGLGSSSSVIIGAIASAYKMAQFKVDKDCIVNRALVYESHPDNITPAVYGGFISAVVNDGKVVKIKKELPQTIKAVVVIPDVPMSTKRSRSALPAHYKMKEAVFNLSHAALLSSAFMSENWDMLKIASKDMMHENIRMRALKELFDVRRIAYEEGALLSTLSGSGSSFLNLVYEKQSNKLLNALKSSFPKFKVAEFGLDNDGFALLES